MQVYFQDMRQVEHFLCAQQVVTCSILIVVYVCSAWLPFFVATTVRTEPLSLSLKNCEVQNLCS